jgi:Zn-dependent protease with chaperone function
MIFIVIITSVLMTLGVEIYIWYLYAIANDTTLSILLSYSTGFMLVFSEILIALLFVFVGIFLSWRFIFKTSDQNLQTVTRLTDRE